MIDWSWRQAFDACSFYTQASIHFDRIHYTWACMQYVPVFFFFFFGGTGELSTLCQVAKVPNEPSLRQNSGSATMCPSDQSMASNPQKWQAKRFGAMTTSRGSKAWSCHDTSVATESCRKDVMCMQYVCPSVRIPATPRSLQGLEESQEMTWTGYRLCQSWQKFNWGLTMCNWAVWAC